jgi:hypothetical protein
MLLVLHEVIPPSSKVDLVDLEVLELELGFM